MTRPNSDRRIRKRLATRQAISDAATRLFMERGFDQVTIDEIAEAADVGRMTVFNHFPRKEDMFFDREQDVRDFAFNAIRSRPKGMAVELASAADRPADDADAYLAAVLLASTWSAAFIHAHAVFRNTGDAEAAKRVFLAMIERGTHGVRSALAGTNYETP